MEMEKNTKIEGGLKIKGRTQKVSSVETPLVSVITIVYNGERHLEQTIKSVLGQTYKNIEYIVVDGGSKDGSLDIVRRYEDRIDYWMSEPDRGISDAMNKGVALAGGDIVGMIHADDWFEPDAVETAVGAMKNYGCDVFCGSLCYYKDEKAFFTDRSKPELLGSYMSVWHPTVFLKNEVYKKEGAFDLKFRSGMDYDLMLRLLTRGYKFASVNKVISNMRTGGTSDQSWRRMLDEEYRIKVKNGAGRIRAGLTYYRKYPSYYLSEAAKKVLGALGLNFIVKLVKKIRNFVDVRFIK